MSEQSNRFAPLQESVEDDEDDAQDGWDDVISIGSNSTDSPLPSSHARGITSKRLRPIHKKKQKAKPHSRRTLYTGKALSDQEITFLSGSYAPTSLQQAAIKVGFPSRAGSFGREGEMPTRSKSSKPDISQASLAGVPSTPSASAPTATASCLAPLPALLPNDTPPDTSISSTTFYIYRPQLTFSHKRWWGSMLQSFFVVGFSVPLLPYQIFPFYPMMMIKARKSLALINSQPITEISTPHIITTIEYWPMET